MAVSTVQSILVRQGDSKEHNMVNTGLGITISSGKVSGKGLSPPPLATCLNPCVFLFYSMRTLVRTTRGKLKGEKNIFCFEILQIVPAQA